MSTQGKRKSERGSERGRDRLFGMAWKYKYIAVSSNQSFYIYFCISLKAHLLKVLWNPIGMVLKLSSFILEIVAQYDYYKHIFVINIEECFWEENVVPLKGIMYPVSFSLEHPQGVGIFGIEFANPNTIHTFANRSPNQPPFCFGLLINVFLPKGKTWGYVKKPSYRVLINFFVFGEALKTTLNLWACSYPGVGAPLAAHTSTPLVWFQEAPKQMLCLFLTQYFIYFLIYLTI